MNAERDSNTGANALADRARPVVGDAKNGSTFKAPILFGLAVIVIAVAAALAMYGPKIGADPQNAATAPRGAAAANGLRLLGSEKEHPLDPALAMASKVKKHIEQDVHDYTATVYKQERYLGELRPLEVCDVKIRSRPFSAYMKFTSPENLKGQEAIFVENANEGKLIGHAGSGVAALLGSKWLPPSGPIAMLNQRYPITELGIENLVKRLIEVGEHDREFGECYVWENDNARVGDRPCISFTVLHPEKRHGFIFHIARIFVDKELQVPLHYEAYDWPAKPGDPPLLLERYTYANLKINVGLTDADFDPRNPNYNFGLK